MYALVAESQPVCCLLDDNLQHVTFFHFAKVLFLSPSLTYYFHVLSSHLSLCKTQPMYLLIDRYPIYMLFAFARRVPNSLVLSQTTVSALKQDPAAISFPWPYLDCEVVQSNFAPPPRCPGKPSELTYSARLVNLILDLKNCKAKRQLVWLRVYKIVATNGAEIVVTDSFTY